MGEFSEKALELYTCENVRKIVSTIYREPNDTITAWVLGTQIPTSAGKIDALFVIALDLYIVEFKAVQATQKDLGQLQRYRSAVRHCSPYQVLKGNALYEPGFIRAVEALDDVKLMLIAPDFTKEALLGADLCVEATHDNGTFEYRAVAYSDSHMEANPQLQKVLTPYLEHLVASHIRLVRWRERQTLTTSAQKTAGNTN